MIRVVLPAHLRTLAHVNGEVKLDVKAPVTQRSVLDALEETYPMLRGTIRDYRTQQRRPFLRLFACELDLSHESVDAPLPEAVVTGAEPLLVIGAMAGGSDAPSRKLNIALWIVQGLLAALFLFAGGVKLIMPIEEMTKELPSIPGWFLRFIAVMEILGGLGLILPGLLRIQPGLTPLAAAGLVIIMIGATVISVQLQGPVGAGIPLVTGLLAVFVAYGRWRPLPHR